MKFLIVLAVAGVCAAIPQGYTPEVAQARSQFFAAYNAAAAASKPASSSGSQGRAVHYQDFSSPQPVYSQRWTGPFAATIPAGVQGSLPNVQQTAEVAAAEAAFRRAYDAAVIATTGRRSTPTYQSYPAPVQHISHNQISGFSVQPQQARWTGPVAATIPAGVAGSGNVVDTAEVAAARAAFNRAFQSQLSAVVAPTHQRYY